MAELRVSKPKDLYDRLMKIYVDISESGEKFDSLSDDEKNEVYTAFKVLRDKIGYRP